MIAPNGMVNVAGCTRSWHAGRRRAITAAATPLYVTSRATALAAANTANEPVSARTSVTDTLNQIAFAGVRYTGWILPKKRGSASFSARANSIRDPARTAPALFPEMEITDPMPIKAAPTGPRNAIAASATGVVDLVTSGSTVMAMIWQSVMMSVT